MNDAMAPEAFERELERLPEVRAARVVASPAGRIVEIHLVTDGSKAPKQITRDVETIAATQGLDIDRRTISIAQMPEGTEPEPAPRPGITLAALAHTTEGAHATCRVRVTLADEDAIGEATATASSSGRSRLIATATIAAVASLTGSRLAADVERALVTDGIALVVLVVVADDGSQVVVPGVCPVRTDDDDAIARAVLDAIGRAPRA
jgi:hypothetical protein